MGDKTGIGWTDATWNPLAGCSIVSPGCRLCYAMDEAARQIRCAAGLNRPTHYAGTIEVVKGRNVWTGRINPAPDHIWERPLRWRRPRRIFVNSMSDLFHENVPDHLIDQAFAIMALAAWHQFQVLTKRSARMRAYMADPEREARWMNEAAALLERVPGLMKRPWPILARREPWLPLPNVWLGVSAEDQDRANERVPDLLATPAAVRFISAEPLIGPIDLVECHRTREKLANWPAPTRVDWVIAGGESDRGTERARPMHPGWVRFLRDQCDEAGVPFFFKQWGEWAPGECAPGPQTRTEDVATWFNSRWDFDRLTPSVSVEMHCDDGPDVWRFGTKKTGNTLDGRKHEEFPVTGGARG